MLKYTTVILMMLALITIDCDSKKIKSNVKPEKPNTVNVNAGEVFTIKIKANHTTGYEWMVAGRYDSTVVSFIDKDYVSDSAPEGMTGVGGNEIWKFKALKKGKVTLKFKEVRPWEANERNPFTKIYKITVK